MTKEQELSNRLYRENPLSDINRRPHCRPLSNEMRKMLEAYDKRMMAMIENEVMPKLQSDFRELEHKLRLKYLPQFLPEGVEWHPYNKEE